MGFGVSGDSSATFMVGADVTIAWLDNRDGQPNAVDYFITGRAQVDRRTVGVIGGCDLVLHATSFFFHSVVEVRGCVLIPWLQINPAWTTLTPAN